MNSRFLLFRFFLFFLSILQWFFGFLFSNNWALCLLIRLSSVSIFLLWLCCCFNPGLLRLLSWFPRARNSGSGSSPSSRPRCCLLAGILMRLLPHHLLDVCKGWRLCRTVNGNDMPFLTLLPSHTHAGVSAFAAVLEESTTGEATEIFAFLIASLPRPRAQVSCVCCDVV